MRVFRSFAVLSLLARGALAAPEPVPSGPPPTQEQIDEGRRLFRVGVALLQDPEGAKFEEARVQFQRAYDLSGTWKVLGNLGVCQLKVERDGEAITSYDRYLAGGGADIDAEERAQVERDVAVLKAQVVTVRLTLPSAGAELVDERTDARGGKVINRYALPAATAELGLHPGEHVLSVRLGARTQPWEASLAPGSTVDHVFEVIPETVAAPGAPPVSAATASPADQGPSGGASRPIPLSVWIGAGVTGALAIGAVGTGVVALGKRSDFDAVNDPGHSVKEKNDAHDAAVSMGVVNTVLTGATLVGAGVTAYLFFTRPEAPRTDHARTLVVPWATAEGGGIAIGGVL